MIVAYSIANQNDQAILNDIDFTHTFTRPADPYEPLDPVVSPIDDGTYACTISAIKGLLKSVNPQMKLYRAVLLDNASDATDEVDYYLSGKTDDSSAPEIKRVIWDSGRVNDVIEGAI